MSHPDESLIRDDDLRARLEEARKRGFAFDTMVKVLASEQRKRDQEKAAEADKQAQLACLPRDRRRRAVIREVIENDGPSPENLRYIHSVLAICGLPYRRLPDNIHEYERKQGRMGLVVNAGKLRAPNGDRIQQPVPFGPKARLLMAYLSSQAIRQQSPTIEIADSLSEFIRELGFEVRGGVRGTLKPFKDQINALAACRMEISAWDGERARTIKAEPFDSIDIWLPSHPDERMLWPTKITFSDKFYSSLISRALPVDMRALRVFSNSARKLDLLFWISYRLNSIEAPLAISWKGLRSQFGEGFAREQDFKIQLAKDVEHMKEVFPKVPLTLSEEGLRLAPAGVEVLAIPRTSKTKKA